MNTWSIKCNFCGEELSYGARRCPYCGSLLGANANKPQSETNTGFSNTPDVNPQPISQPISQPIPQPISQPIPPASDNRQEVYSGEEPVSEAYDKDESYNKNESYYNYESIEKADQNKKESQITDKQADGVNTQSGNYYQAGAVNNSLGSNPHTGYTYGLRNDDIDPGCKPLSNGTKVFLTSISTVLWIGQLVGIIAAIIYMNSEYDADRKSFGVALMVASLIFFVVESCLGCFIAMGIF